MHTAGEVAVAGAVCTVPGAQASEATQLVWLGTVEWVPSAQAVHFRSMALVPAEVT